MSGVSVATCRPSISRLFALAFITGFSGAIMPGPLLVMNIQQTTIQGLVAPIGLITGHALLELVTVALLVAGLGAVLRRPRVRGVVGLLGGAALVYMGIDMLRRAAGLSLALEQSTAEVYSFGMLMFFGAAVCAANPYFLGWWAAVGMGQLAHMAPRTVAEYLAFYLGHESSDYVWYRQVGVLIVGGRQWLTDGMYRGLIYVCGAIIALLGVWFLVSGTRFVLGRVGETGPEPAAS